ncbi:MAG: hypothetical protein J6S40_05905, partial [Thermoguttaceae bacterium]|nr:hypothetical protein [Thermoguttaceae bacterium]
MKKSFVLRSAFIIAVSVLTALSSLTADAPPEDRAAVDARTAELAALITAEPVRLIPPITDREKWENFASLFDSSRIVDGAAKLLTEPIPELPEDLYKEFYANGNRTNYQNARQVWADRCMTLAMAELIENKGRFLPALEEIVRKFCDYPSWSLPAHDYGAQIYDGKMSAADLAATNLAGELGLIRSAMESVLSPGLCRTVEENIRRRVLEPLRKNVCGEKNRMMWWVTGTNNWNPVCFCGTTAAALSVCRSADERAWYLAAAEHFVSTRFFSGITDDGYCSEGIGYW